MTARRGLALAALTALAGCGGTQSTLDPGGPYAREIAMLSWGMFAGAGVITLIVGVLLAWAVWGRASKPAWLSDTRIILGGGLILPSVVLAALLIPTLAMGLRQSGDGEADLRIRVTGEQWWWRVQYVDANGATIETANEIRIPVGATVAFELHTADVIHSFWVPALAGKLDMMPGQTNVLRIRADTPGTYRGQCAEFCGGAHAMMAMHVVVQTPEDFTAWLAAQRAPARDAEAAARGRAVFFAAGCGACHMVRGTPAQGRLGPDLTHVGGRGFIAGGTLATTRENLKHWITDSQQIKPDNRMPEFGVFGDDDIGALAAWLESLT